MPSCSWPAADRATPHASANRSRAPCLRCSTARRPACSSTCSRSVRSHRRCAGSPRRRSIRRLATVRRHAGAPSRQAATDRWRAGRTFLDRVRHQIEPQSRGPARDPRPRTYIGPSARIAPASPASAFASRAAAIWFRRPRSWRRRAGDRRCRGRHRYRHARRARCRGNAGALVARQAVAGEQGDPADIGRRIARDRALDGTLRRRWSPGRVCGRCTASRSA